MKMSSLARRSIVALALVLALPVFGQKNVVQPGDPIIASSSNGPGSEGVANAIDGKTTKYLNFDSRLPDPIKPSGFIVSPSVGVTWVTGMRIQSANDEQDRDPKTVILAGSNADTPPAWDDAAWEPITTIDVPDYTTRFQWQDFSFSNFKAYKHYQWKVTQTRNSNGCCMQVAEVELIGRTLPQDITQPGDPIVASSSNGPGSEGVANAIDNKTTKYLNFDSRLPDPIKPSGFVVSPQFGRSVVVGMTIESANDEQDRDPKTVILSGSNADTAPAWDDPSWETIQTINVPDFATRFQTQTFLWNNVQPYKHYQWKVTQTRNSNGCCMQVAEVELLGTPAPKDVTQPGDAIVASSSNGPGSEGVANAIDNKTTKYLNFDSRLPDPIKPSGFVVTPSVGATTLTGMTIESANDEQDRDPKTVILSGSNADTAPAWDDASWETIQTINVPDFATRFQTQEFFFANSKSYKHYQWKVTQTRNSNGCCMQVAEVELLAVQEGADCSKAKFLSQPINQPVLANSKATFNTTVNGPWPLQWTKNGQPIPGATGTSLTTDVITAANTADVYAVTIVGCETSQSVQAQIFTPSTAKSVAVSFTGGGANGAPTKVNDDDILGIQLQAHWNNATLNPDGSGAAFATPATGSLPDASIDPAPPVLDSDGNATDITFSWEAGGNWGSGSGQTTATDRMLNGLVGRAGTGANTFTFGNVPAGTHSVLVYSVSPPLQFQTVSYNIGATTYYMRVMNSDEYNSSPGFFRGSGTSVSAATIGDYIRFDNVSPDASGNIVLTTDTIVGAAQATGVNGIQLVLNTTAGGAPPVITVAPSPVVAAAGKTARLSVTATGAGLTYQWRKAGRNISNGANISGATSAELTISDFSAADVGVYSVAVFNPNGSVISGNATASLSIYNINDALVGYWKLDETTGTTAANSAPGAAANSVGVVNGTATWALAQINGGITLDGATFLFVTNYPKATKAISGAAWVNIDPNTAADVAIFRNAQGDLAANAGGGQFEVGLAFVTLPDGITTELHAMAAVGIGPNIARATGSTAFPTGSWHQIAFSADGAQLRVYVDGQQVAVTDYLADINPPSIQFISMGEQLNLSDPADPTSLGPDPTNPKPLVGQLDDVALWNRALTAQEVQLAYTAGAAHKAVTTVVEVPPVTEPKLTTSKLGNTLTINFDAGKLQSTTSLAPGATWTDVTNPTQSPYSEQMTATTKFFRAVQ
jgi:hypothetical protein